MARRREEQSAPPARRRQSRYTTSRKHRPSPTTVSFYKSTLGSSTQGRKYLPAGGASELQQIIAEVLVCVGCPGQATTLKRRDEAVGDLDDVLPGQPRLPWTGDEEPIPPDLLHDLCHALGDLVRCANELDRPVHPFCHKLPQGLPTAPLREFVQ